MVSLPTQSATNHPFDSLLAGLIVLTQAYGLRLNQTAVIRDFDPDQKGLTEASFFAIADRIQFPLMSIDIDQIDSEMALPALIWQGSGEHLILLAIDEEQYQLLDLRTQATQWVTEEDYQHYLESKLIVVNQTAFLKAHPDAVLPQRIKREDAETQTQIEAMTEAKSLEELPPEMMQSVMQMMGMNNGDQQESAPLNDLALRALVLLAKYHGEAVNAEDIQHTYDPQGEGLTERQWLLAAKAIGLKAKVIKQHPQRMHLASLPAFAWRQDGQHFLIIKVSDDEVLIQDLASSQSQILTHEQFQARYEGRIIAVTSRASIMGSLAKFDFTWFVPAIVKYRRILLEVMIISIFIQLFALVTPLFFQVVMDKVLVHRAFTTLDVIVVALLVISVFEVVLNGLRTFVFAHTTSRIDVELGARLFRHMLALPIAYFESRRVGETVARIRELDQIRNFLTGQALTSVLDLMFSFIFIAVMLYYSVWLTLIVVASLPCYFFWSAFISPVLRARLNDKFSKNADNQSFLVESVTGINTIKSMAVEPQTTTQWDKLLASYVHSSFRVTRLANIGQQGVQLIQKIVSITTLWLGAQLVIGSEMTVGQLIAFNMLAGQVAAPIVRLAQLWQDFQQVGISVARLGDILNTPTENPQSRLVLPPIEGKIEFENLVFRYRPDGPEILHNINLTINAGEIIGIVGRSGSGKSTLTKLVQRMYVPERGRTMIDGTDLSLADPSWLRRQIGVVLQENLLFNRSIKDNIALSNPGMALEEVIVAAKMAGAHEFIMDLPEGYDTPVGEQGSTLSGGQRQRIAIARALIGNPRILIFDEATSALDYESEKAIMDNMQTICKDRTVLIIAHRLSTVRMSDRIIVMEKGEIIEEGTHESLLTEKGHYAYLHQLQSH